MNASHARPYLGIGEVLASLRADFPDISVSKIRFLESEGLIAPARSPSGYRKFAVADVERLRYILTAQRDQYLPLRVIKERLVPDAAGCADGSGPGARAPGPAAPGGRGRGARLTRRDLLEAAGIDEEKLAELEDYGLVRREGRQYGPDALEVARTVAALAAYGVEARHLRAVRAAAERETSLIEQVIAPTLRQHNAAARENAGRTARQIAALSLRLHRVLIEIALAEAGLPGSGLPDTGLPDAGPGWPADAGDEAAGRTGAAAAHGTAARGSAGQRAAAHGTAGHGAGDDFGDQGQRRAAAGGGGHAGRGYGGASA
jgi:DNA-binding transcriptional MerR regulator